MTTEALGALAARDWLHGVLPWWNPYSGVGLPLAAEGQTPAFFLPFVLLLALPHGLLALRLVLMALAGVFTFTLLRRMGLAVGPALVAALLFESNGTFAWFAHGPIMPIAFLPLMLLGLEQARNGGFPVAVTAGVAWSFLAGFPETAVLDLGLAGAWGAMRTLRSQRPWWYAGRCLAAAAAGLLIAAPAMWPFLEGLPRAFAGEHTVGLGGSLRPANLALALFPTLLGNPLCVAGAPGWISGVWWRAGGYLPVSLLALALAALRRSGPELALRWGLAGFVAVTALQAGGVPVFRWVPLLRQAAVHLYVWPAWSMVVCVLAGLALEDWREGRRPSVSGAGLVSLVACAVALWLGAPALGWMLRAPPPLFHPAFWVTVGVGAAVVVLLLLRGTASQGRQSVMAVMTCGQSAVLFAFWLLAGPHGRVVDSGALRFLQAHVGLGRLVGFGPMVPNYGAFFDLAEVGFNELPVPAAWVTAASGRLQPGFDGINLYEGALPAPGRLRAAIPAYEAMGAAYALTWPSEDLGARFDGASLAYHGATMDVWALPAPATYVEAPGCAVHAQDRLILRVRCAAPSRLIRRELFVPGWQASINGVAAPVRRADIFQVVDVPRGDSVVRFTYAPPGIGWAWAGCATGGLLLVGATVWRLGRKRIEPLDEAST